MLIDFHTHAFNPKIAEKAISQLQDCCHIEPYTRGLIPQLINRMDEWGVDKACMLPIATKTTQQKIINDWAAEINDSYDRILAFGTVHPQALNALQEAKRIKKLGLYGVKLHPDYQQFMVDDPALDPLYDCLTELELPVIFHAGLDTVSPQLIHCTPKRAANMFKRHPDMKVIFAHLGGNECWDRVYELLAGLDGQIYLDTAFCAACPDELMTKIIKRHGSERILFASDCPWESSAKMAEKLLRLDISDDDREKIFYKNAASLLGLKDI